MYCQSCGASLAWQMKYCNHCGAALVALKETEALEPAEKRLHKEIVDIFWVTVLGLVLILGGIGFLKKILQLGDGLIIAYLILSSIAFIINFALSLWQIFRLAKFSREEREREREEARQFDTNRLKHVKAGTTLESVSSVIEETTRNLDLVSKEQIGQ